MQKEIGSNFDLDPRILMQESASWNLEQIGITGADSAMLSTGRSAEGLILDEIECRHPELKKIALIPAFTCQTVIEPFIKRGYSVKTYSIDENLRINPETFKEELYESHAQIVLIHQYFGFHTAGNIEQLIREETKKGIVFIEDRTQCLYSSFPILSVEYVIGSMRKWAALPDGGFAVCRHGKLHEKPEYYDAELEIEKIEAAEEKYKYLHENQGEKQIFLEKFSLAECMLDKQEKCFKISPSSLKVQSSLNIDELKQKRRDNYERLYFGLEGSRCVRVVTPPLKKENVPLYYVCLAENRESLQRHLRENRIYAPIVWPKSQMCPVVCKEAEEMYEKSLCIPIDQRYDIDDMDKVVKCIKEFDSQCQSLKF